MKDIIERNIEALPGIANWFASELQNYTGFHVNNLSDILRLIMLYEGGGTYLDTDVISLKSLEDIQETKIIGWENDEKDMELNVGVTTPTICNAIFMKFPSKDPFIRKLIYNITSDFQRNEWGYGGPLTLSKLWREAKEKFEHSLEQQDSKETELSLPTVLAKQYLYPIGWQQVGDLFTDISKSDHQVNSLIARSYTVHLWASLVGKHFDYLKKNDLLARIYEKACPVTYRNHFLPQVESRFAKFETLSGFHLARHDETVFNIIDKAGEIQQVNHPLVDLEVHIRFPSSGSQLFPQWLMQLEFTLDFNVNSQGTLDSLNTLIAIPNRLQICYHLKNTVFGRCLPFRDVQDHGNKISLATMLPPDQYLVELWVQDSLTRSVAIPAYTCFTVDYRQWQRRRQAEWFSQWKKGK
eukprot:g2903.t1